MVLKQLTDDDLAYISDKFGEILNTEIAKKIPLKELEDLDLDIVIDYQDKQLDVSVDAGIAFDELSNINQESLNKAIDEAYLKFDDFIESNYME